MRQTYVSQVRLPIDPINRSTVISELEISTPGSILDVDVAVAIDHTYVDDLALVLQAPDGSTVVLAADRGGSGDDYATTVFDDDALRSIQTAAAPSAGRYRPAEPLSSLAGKGVQGTWRLYVLDQAVQDGGELLGWAISVDVGEEPAGRGYEIVVDFEGGLTARQQEAFFIAAVRWQRIITAPLTVMQVDTHRTTTGVVISARGTNIDGEGRILGQAAPTHIRPGSGLPYRGVMEFDTADLAAMEADGSLLNVIVHEMGHVLGIGTLWDDLVVGEGGTDPRFTGPSGVAEWQELEGTGGVPVANTGGPGTRDSHWREQTFGDELMTGLLSGTAQPLSSLTVGCLADLGYAVDFEQADPFGLPTPFVMALLGVDSDVARRCHVFDGGRYPDPIVGPLPDLIPG
jgi:subtilisin-like proprotein convertase family protein